MTVTEHDTTRTAVRSPIHSGMVRHFRVQVHEVKDNGWRMYAAFRRRDQAEDCLGKLHAQGYRTRLVDCDRCPAAL